MTFKGIKDVQSLHPIAAEQGVFVYSMCMYTRECVCVCVCVGAEQEECDFETQVLVLSMIPLPVSLV